MAIYINKVLTLPTNFFSKFCCQSLSLLLKYCVKNGIWILDFGFHPFCRFMQHCLRNHAALFEKSCSTVFEIMQHCFLAYAALFFNYRISVKAIHCKCSLFSLNPCLWCKRGHICVQMPLIFPIKDIETGVDGKETIYYLTRYVIPNECEESQPNVSL